MSNDVQERLCEECEEPIAPARVRALPNVRLCIDCAQDQEDEARGRAPRRGGFLGRRHQDSSSVAAALREMTES